ncbi:MAG: hypothetical protein M1381_06675 [Deltaproteobacteria bacterium]|nr:hypothetical protein [Deltaproteobacteria bacterium]MCL5792958.1 hypothetical protein [Deltaproteobacteria bacterium]
MKTSKLHLLSEAKTVSYTMLETSLSKENKRVIEKIAPTYPNPLQPAINWQDYIANISNDKRITNYAVWLSTFVGSQPFLQLQIQKNTSQNSNHKTTQSDLDYKHLADYAGFLFICLFNKWTDKNMDSKFKDDIKQKIDAFKAYYEVEKIKERVKENPYIKIENTLTIKEGLSKALHLPDGTLKIASSDHLSISNLVVEKFINKQPIPFEQEGTKGKNYTIATPHKTLQNILENRLIPYVEIYESPFTLCTLTRWVKKIDKEKERIKNNQSLPLNIEYFAGSLYTYAVQYCTDKINKWLDLLIAIVTHFSKMSGYSITENTIRKQFDKFKNERKKPVRKNYNKIFLQSVSDNTINKYFILFHNAFREWKLDLLYRQGTIKTKYYVKIESAQEFKKELDLMTKSGYYHP